MKKILCFLIVLLSSFYGIGQEYTLRLTGSITQQQGPPFWIGSSEVLIDGNTYRSYSDANIRNSITIDETNIINGFTNLQLKAVGIIGNFPPACEGRNETNQMSLEFMIASQIGTGACGVTSINASVTPNIGSISTSPINTTSVCIGNQLSLVAPPDFPNIAYNWEYSINGTTWLEFRPSFNLAGQVSATFEQIIGSNHEDFLGNNIMIRVGGYSKGQFSDNILTVNYSACAPLTTGLNYSPPNCTDDPINVSVMFSRPLNTGENFDSISIIDVITDMIIDQKFNVSMDSPTGNTFTFNNIDTSGLLEGQTFRVQYQMQINGVQVPGFINSSQTFTFNDKAPVTFNTNHTDVSCSVGQGNSSDGTLIINTLTGGTPPYEYSINGGTFTSFSGTSITFPNQSDGDYTIRVQDSNGCDGTSGGNTTVTETIDAATAITITNTTLTDVTFFGGNNGSISLVVSGGTTPPLTYSWSGSNGFSSNSKDISNLFAGTYTLIITDNPEGCSTSRNFTVTEPTLFQFITQSPTDVTCGDTDNTNDNGTITARATGGLTNYRYELFLRNASNIYASTGNIQTLSAGVDFRITNLSAGAYRVAATDDGGSGITITTDLTIATPPVFSFSTTKTDVTCRGVSTGSINLTITGGTPDIVGGYNIIWSGPNSFSSTNEDLSNLAAGLYTLQLTDAPGCAPINPSIDYIIEITEPTTAVTASIPANGIQNPTFNGASDGSINIDVTGGTTIYTYVWTKDGDGSFTRDTKNITGLSDGTYNVLITDSTGCTDTITGIVIAEPDPLVASITLETEILCFSGANSTGALRADAIGGVPNPVSGYTYEWFRRNTSNVFVSIGQFDIVESNLIAGFYQVEVTDNNGISDRSDTFELESKPEIIIKSIIATDVNCFGGSDGTIVIDAEGGTGTLQYSRNNGASYQSSNIFTGLMIGTYDIIVRDANLCETVMQQETIIGPINPINITGTENDVTIFGQNTGSITINANGGNGGYTYNWTGPNGFSSNNKDVSNLFEGTYTVIVQDNRFGSTPDNAGCSATEIFTITEPDELLVNIDYETTDTDLKCDGDDNARIFATVSGGDTPYSYSWFKETSIGSGVFTPLSDTSALLIGVDEGNYKVEVGDPNGAMTSDEFIVTDPDPLAIIVSETDIDCFGDATGAIDITVSGGTAPYQYLWSNGAITEDILGLISGDYTVTITDANDCKLSSATITLTQPLTPIEIADATVESLTGFQTNNGSIDITASGGTSPYTYEWRVQGTATIIETDSRIENLASATYEVTIKDAKDCILIEDYFVDQPDLLEIINIQLQNPLQCFGDTTVSLTATLAGGVTPYTYRWYEISDPTTTLSTTDIVTDLGEGTYIIDIIDANGNRTSETTNIVNPLLLEATYTTQDVSCNGGNDASIDLTVTGGTGAYTFFWSNGDNTEDISVLSTGIYSVTIRDANLCETNVVVNITEPVAGLSIVNTNITDASGNGLTNGSIQVTAAGGTPAYTYNWTDSTNTPIGTNSNLLNNIGTGSYFLTLTDTNGCILGPIEYIVGEPDPLLVTTTEISIPCFGENGELFANVTGGVPPYTYQWFDTTNTLINTSSSSGAIPTGIYRVIIIDTNANQTEVDNINLIQPNLLEITNISVTDVGCYNGTDGNIEITVTGGTGNYTYQWNTLGSSTNTLTGVSAGNYDVTVTDENNCSATSGTITVTQPVVYDITDVAIIRPSGTGTTDGSIAISITGGAAPYTYQWTDNLNAIVLLESNVTSTSSTLTNQAEGIYNIVVTDADGCTINHIYNLANPGELLVSINQTQQISCFGGSDGVLEVITTGGIGGNNYQWFDATTNIEIGNTNILSGIPTGSYYIIVSNAEGISEQSAVFNVAQPLAVTGNLAGDNPDCFGGTDGSITITASGGNGSYQYRYRVINGSYSTWIPFNNGSVTQITNLPDGIYQVQLQDSNGCFYGDNGSIGILSIRLNQPDQLIVASVLLNDPTGFGLTNGNITTTTAGGTAPYTYQWSDTNGILSQTTQILTDIGAGTYTLIITDALGCQTSETFTLNQPEELLVTVDIVNIVLCNADTNGSIRAITTGGIGTYTYQWFLQGDTTPIGNNAIISGIGAGNYYVIVTDTNNNTAQSEIITLTQPDPLQLNLTADFILCGDGNDWRIESTITGGTAPYSYFWDAGNGTMPNLLDVLPGTYTLTVQDSRGCNTSETITLTPPPPLENTVSQTDPTCFGGNDGFIDITPTGGTPPYMFFWDNGANTEDLTGLTAGLYSVEIFDSKGCSIIQDFELVDPEELIIDLGSDKTLCLGQTYTIDATISDPLATYLWQADNGFSADTAQVMLSDSGNYTVFVTTALGCVSTDTIEIVALENEIAAEFVISTDLFVNESFVIVDVSNPLPDTVEWILPDEAEQIDITDRYAELKFNQAGDYEITLRTTLGDCEVFFTKSITVREAAFDRDQENKNGLQQYLMYPNPTRGNFTIELTFDKETPIDIKLFSIANNSLLYQHQEQQQTEYNIPFNLEGVVPSGIYFILLETPEKSYVRKIVVE